MKRISMRGLTPQVAIQLRRDTKEVEGLWRRSKKHCNAAGKKGDYLMAIRFLATALKVPSHRIEGIPQVGDVLVFAPPEELRVVGSTPLWCVCESADGVPVLVPLASFLTLT